MIGYIKHGTSFGRMQLSLNSIGNQSGSSLTNTRNLVYFQKDTRSSKVNSDWTIGRVDQVRRGKDGLIREATVAYRNCKETFNRLTDRAERSLLRLF